MPGVPRRLDRFEPAAVAGASLLFFLSFGALLAIWTPPFAGPDEPFHWQRAMQIAGGHLLPEKLGPNDWGGPIDRAGYLDMLHYFGLIEKHAPVDAADSRALSRLLASRPPGWRVVPFPSTATYAPLAYLPQAAGIAVARALGLPPLDQMHAGRIGNLLVYGLAVAAVVAALPAGRLVALAIALSPVALQGAVSLSADPLNLTLPILLLALVWRYRDRGVPLGVGEALGLLALSAGLGLLKLTIAPFAGAVLALPGAVMGNGWRRLGFAVLCLTVACGVALAWNLAHPFVPGLYWGTGADPAAQIARLRAAPLETARAFAATIGNEWLMWWRDSYGRYGGHPSPWSGYTSDRVIFPAFWVLLALPLADGYRFGRRARDPLVIAGLPLAAVAYVLLLMAAFWVAFTPVGAPVVEGIQGRYFLLPELMALLGVAAAAGAWEPAGPRRVLRLALFAAALALNGAVLVQVLHAWRALWV